MTHPEIHALTEEKTPRVLLLSPEARVWRMVCRGRKGRAQQGWNLTDEGFWKETQKLKVQKSLVTLQLKVKAKKLLLNIKNSAFISSISPLEV